MGRCLQTRRQNPWSNHRAIHPKVCVRCVRRTAVKCWKKWQKLQSYVFFTFTPIPGKMIQYWRAFFFQLDWFNHQRESGFFVMEEKQTCFKAATMMPWCLENLNLPTFAVPKWMQQQVCLRRCGAREKCSANLRWLDLQSFTKTTWKRRAWLNQVSGSTEMLGHGLNKRLPHKWEAVCKVNMLCGQDDVVLSAMRFITISGIIVLLSCPSIEQDLKK